MLNQAERSVIWELYDQMDETKPEPKYRFSPDDGVLLHRPVVMS